MRKVIYLSTDPESGKGGIASAVKNSMMFAMRDRSVELIVTHSPSYKLIGNLFLFFKSFLKLIFIDRKAIYYIHVGPRGSLIRKIILASTIRIFGGTVHVHYHSPEFLKYIRQGGFWCCCLRLLFNVSHRNIALSEYWRKIFKFTFQQSVDVLFNPIPIVPEALSRNSFSKKTNHEIQVLCVARLVPEKNVIDIIPLLLKYSQMRLTVIGDGPERKNIQHAVDNHNLQSRVRFLGWLKNDQVLAHMVEADLFVLPSKYDSFGVVYLESLSVGLPVLVPKIYAVKIVLKSLPGTFYSEEKAIASISEIDRGYISEMTNVKYGENAYINNLNSIFH